MKKKPTRSEINEQAKAKREEAFNKIRIEAICYFARWSCTKPSPDLIRALILIQSAFAVTEAPNLKAAQGRMNEVILQSQFLLEGEE